MLVKFYGRYATFRPEYFLNCFSNNKMFETTVDPIAYEVPITEIGCQY